MQMQTLARQNKAGGPDADKLNHNNTGVTDRRPRKSVINVHKFKNQNLRPMLINSKLPAEFRDGK